MKRAFEIFVVVALAIVAAWCVIGLIVRLARPVSGGPKGPVGFACLPANPIA